MIFPDLGLWNAFVCGTRFGSLQHVATSRSFLPPEKPHRWISFDIGSCFPPSSRFGSGLFCLLFMLNEALVKIIKKCTNSGLHRFECSDMFQEWTLVQTTAQKLSWEKITIKRWTWISYLRNWWVLDSASDILFLTSQNSCRVVFNVSVTVCVVSHLNLCLCHVTVPNSLVSLHKAVLGVQDGQSDIDFSSFWRSFLLKCHGEQ